MQTNPKPTLEQTLAQTQQIMAFHIALMSDRSLVVSDWPPSVLRTNYELGERKRERESHPTLPPPPTTPLHSPLHATKLYPIHIPSDTSAVNSASTHRVITHPIPLHSTPLLCIPPHTAPPTSPHSTPHLGDFLLPSSCQSLFDSLSCSVLHHNLSRLNGLLLLGKDVHAMPSPTCSNSCFPLYPNRQRCSMVTS